MRLEIIQGIDVKTLKRHYAKAVKNSQTSFTVYGYKFLTEYAKYLIEYAEGKAK